MALAFPSATGQGETGNRDRFRPHGEVDGEIARTELMPQLKLGLWRVPGYYGYDEWFQLAALYPRMVQRGTLTFLPNNTLSALLPPDIEYVTGTNRRSEIVHF